jgi:hypothetical protein
MEDTKNVKSQPNATDPRKGPIIELTPAQEIHSAVREKIIDLVHVHDSQTPAEIDVAPSLSAPAKGGMPAAPAATPLKAYNPEPVQSDLESAEAEFAAMARSNLQAPVAEVASEQESMLDAPDPLNEIASELELSLHSSDMLEPTQLSDVDEEIEEIELSLDTHPAVSEAHAQATRSESDNISDDLDDLLQPDDGNDADMSDDRTPIQTAPIEDPVDAQPDEPALILEDEPALNLEEDDADAILELTETVAPSEKSAGADDPRGGLPVENEDPIIELIEILDPSPAVDPAAACQDDADDGIIELIDIVDPAELCASADVAQAVSPIEDEDPVIELTDAVDPVETDAPALIPDEDGDVILELTDTVDPQAAVADTQPVAAASDTMDGDGPVEPTGITASPESESNADPLIIDPVEALEAIVPVEPLETAETSLEIAALESAASDITWPEDGQFLAIAAENQAADPTPDLTEAHPDTVIHLDSVLKAHKQRLANQVTRQINKELTADQDKDEAHTGLELEGADHWCAETIELTDNALQKAIEQVIRTQYARRIEEMIALTVERVVAREMESIRNSLMIDGEPDA